MSIQKTAFNNNQLLDIQVRAMQQYIPEKVKWRGKLIKLNKKEQLAIGRAIWYIIKKGYGISTAVTKASGSFGVRDGKVERGTRAVFPKGYFISLQESNNAETVIELVKL